MLKKFRGMEDIKMSLSTEPNQFDTFLLLAAYFSKVTTLGFDAFNL